jgi:hypothetical protein
MQLIQKRIRYFEYTHRVYLTEITGVSYIVTQIEMIDVRLGLSSPEDVPVIERGFPASWQGAGVRYYPTGAIVWTY